VMVLLGGIQTLTGPVWGAVLFTWLQDAVARGVDYWRAVIGGVILLIVLAFPHGVTGFLRARFAR
jgi:branched-chain amino acid transport system permease protein